MVLPGISRIKNKWHVCIKNKNIKHRQNYSCLLEAVLTVKELYAAIGLDYNIICAKKLNYYENCVIDKKYEHLLPRCSISASGYLIKIVNKKHVFLHKLIAEMEGLDISNQIDHVNRNKLDNRVINLRPATNMENSRNKAKLARNTSGITGVYRDKARNCWQAKIAVSGKLISLGRHQCKLAAYLARKEAEIKYFGAFAPA